MTATNYVHVEPVNPAGELLLAKHLLAGIPQSQIGLLLLTEQSRPILFRALTELVAKLEGEAAKVLPTITFTYSSGGTTGQLDGQWAAHNSDDYLPFSREESPAPATPKSAFRKSWESSRSSSKKKS